MPILLHGDQVRRREHEVRHDHAPGGCAVQGCRCTAFPRREVTEARSDHRSEEKCGQEEQVVGLYESRQNGQCGRRRVAIAQPASDGGRHERHDPGIEEGGPVPEWMTQGEEQGGGRRYADAEGENGPQQRQNGDNEPHLAER